MDELPSPSATGWPFNHNESADRAYLNSLSTLPCPLSSVFLGVRRDRKIMRHSIFCPCIFLLFTFFVYEQRWSSGELTREHLSFWPLTPAWAAHLEKLAWTPKPKIYTFTPTFSNLGKHNLV